MSDLPSPTLSTGPLTVDSENPIYKSADYRPILSNWFTAKPYGFRFTSRSGVTKVMYLPLGPSNLSIVTQFATNIIPTITGTIEEHSPVRYYDIIIEGTTGMTPKFIEPSSPEASLNGAAQPGRSSFTVQQSLSTLAGGFFAKTLSAADKVYNTPNELSFGRSATTGISLDQTGYLAFHNLYRFFLQYKKDVAGVDDQTPRKGGMASPLVFFNHKDGNEYSVIIRTFVLRRDKENPMLYFYNISLRGYDLGPIKNTNGTNNTVSEGKFLANLGLNGVKNSTFLSDLKEKADLGRDVLASVANGINQLGR